MSDWYVALDGTQKRPVMLGALVLAAAWSLEISCLGAPRAGGVPLPPYSAAGMQSVIEALAQAAGRLSELLCTQAKFSSDPDLPGAEHVATERLPGAVAVLAGAG